MIEHNRIHQKSRFQLPARPYCEKFLGSLENYCNTCMMNVVDTERFLKELLLVINGGL